jgi:integrase
MASLRTFKESPFWFAVYRDANGTQCNRSTKIQIAGDGTSPKDRAKDAARKRNLAKMIAARLEEVERGNPTEIHLRKVMHDIFAKVNHRRMDEARTNTFLASWLATVQSNRKASTWDRYQRVVNDFLTAMGTRANVVIGDVTVQDIQPYIDAEVRSGKNGATIRMAAKVLGAAFAHAHRQGLTQLNPAAGVVLPDQVGETRAPFAWKQVRALLGAATGEWKTAIMIGVFTGARLGDCVSMRWKNVDLVNKVISFRPQKTSRKAKDLVVPIHSELERQLLSLKMPDGAGANEAHLTPTLAITNVGGRYGLSRLFQDLMREAGIENEKLRVQSGAGRTFYKYGFHSLRHTFNTTLMNLGVAQELRMKLSGHASEEMNARYSHAELDTLRAAVAKIPTLQK